MLALRALHAEPPGASGERLGRWHEGVWDSGVVKSARKRARLMWYRRGAFQQAM
jgi:hypothetical protein